MLSACGTRTVDLRPAVDTPAADTLADDVPPATVGCDPARVQALLGEVASTELAARARDAAGAHTVRALAPGQAMTREYAEGRLNLQLDAQHRVVRAYCG